jgi:hypothetical protein
MVQVRIFMKQHKIWDKTYKGRRRSSSVLSTQATGEGQEEVILKQNDDKGKRIMGQCCHRSQLEDF